MEVGGECQAIWCASSIEGRNAGVQNGAGHPGRYRCKQSVGGARRGFSRKLLQIDRQIWLLQGAQRDTGVDAVFGVLERAFAAGDILRCEKTLRIVAEFFIAKITGEGWKAARKRFAGFLFDRREVALEKFPGRGLDFDIAQQIADEIQVLIFYFGSQTEIDGPFGEFDARELGESAEIVVILLGSFRGFHVLEVAIVEIGVAIESGDAQSVSGERGFN